MLSLNPRDEEELDVGDAPEEEEDEVSAAGMHVLEDAESDEDEVPVALTDDEDEVTVLPLAVEEEEELPKDGLDELEKMARELDEDPVAVDFEDADFED